MIDWAAGLGCGAALADKPAHVAAVLAAARQRVGVVQNVDFPMSPLPLLLRAESTRAWARDVEAYVQLLSKVISLFLDEPAVRSWYGIGPQAERLVMADGDPPGVAVCRLDGYLRQGTEQPCLLENNADAPAGTLFTGRINRLVQHVLEELGAAAGPLSPATYLDENALLDTLLARVPGARHIAILQPHGAVTAESVAMADVFSAAGVDAYVADPRSLRIVGDRVHFGDRPADVCWNKLNTAPWRAMVAGEPDLVDRFARALATPRFTHVNSFGARYVAESKLSLALPQEPEFAHLFTPEERALVERLLPWARRVTASLAPQVIRDQHEYVLKEPYDIRGDGVTVGRVTPTDRWRAAVRNAVEHGHLAQAYVPPVAYPVVQFEGPIAVPMSISLDSFVLGGRFRGFGSKASLQARVNVFRGGRKLAAHVLADAGNGLSGAASAEGAPS
jgi:hypothetical protein